MTNVLSTKAILADVTIRRWTGRKLDRKITDEVNEQHQADADAGRYNKLLIPKAAFGDIHALTSQARHKHILMTMPWSNAGPRILPTAMYDEFAATFRKLRDEYNEAADKFAKSYPTHLAGAEKRLKTMFNRDDYPDPKKVRGMFDFKVSIQPCPDTDDFRIKIGKEQLEDMKNNLQADLKSALKEALNEPVRRIAKVVEKMAIKLKEYKPAERKVVKVKDGGKSKKKVVEKAENTFRDTLVTNIQEILPLLGAFNLTGDENLAALFARVEKELCANDAEVLREDDAVRAKVQKAAEDILQQANNLMS